MNIYIMINLKKKNSKENKDILCSNNSVIYFCISNIFKILFITYLHLFLIIYNPKVFNKNNNIKVSNFLSEEKNNYKNRINEIINMKKVAYTAIIGNYDKLKNIYKQDDWDYFAFLFPYDKNKYKNTNWTVLPISDYILNLDVDNYKKQRYLKMHPHLLFPNYTISLYIDGSMSIKGDLNEFLLRLLTPNYNLFMLEHPERNCIYKEMEEVVALNREKKEKTDFLEKKYLEMNFPKEYGLIEGNIIVRKHNEKECIEFMEEWWKMVKNYSYRDQLSFNYILWKNGFKIKYFSKRFSRSYFIHDIWHLIREKIE